MLQQLPITYPTNPTLPLTLPGQTCICIIQLRRASMNPPRCVLEVGGPQVAKSGEIVETLGSSVDNLDISFIHSIYERVAVGRKY